MKKFVLLYHSPAKAPEMTPEQQEKGMQAWFQWRDKMGDKLVDFGAPFSSSATTADGDWKETPKNVGGYSIVKSKDLKSAKSLLVNHPHLAWAPGCEIEVLECVDM